MITIKFDNMKKMQKDELEKKLADMRIELMKLNSQVATGTTPKSTKQIREIKKNIARYETLRMETFNKQLGELKDSKSNKLKKYIHS